MVVKFRYRYCSVEMFYNFKRALIENIILLVLFSEDRNFAIHNNLVLASFRKINLIFINLLVWLFIVAFYEMSSFVVIQVVICRTFDWKYNNTVEKKVSSLFFLFIQKSNINGSIYTSILDPLPLTIMGTRLAMMEQQTEYDRKW